MSGTSTDIDIKKKVSHLPLAPGVYMFKDSGNRVLYVGKAKRLRNRVRSYFQDSANHDGRIRVMIGKIEDLEVIITDSEAEALILENNLIKNIIHVIMLSIGMTKAIPIFALQMMSVRGFFPHVPLSMTAASILVRTTA